MLVTELGMLMLVSAVQPEKAYGPMLVTELGMLTLLSEEQSEKV
jgi:hypothetical protein